MKKLLLLAIAFGSFSMNQLSGQCTPGNINVDFQPSINSPLSGGPIGTQYSTTILFKAPSTISVSVTDIPQIPQALSLGLAGLGLTSISAEVNTMIVNGISGQPTGLDATIGGGLSGSFAAGQQGCIEISGIPLQSGNYTITLDVQYSITINPGDINAALSLIPSFTVPTPISSPVPRTYTMSIPVGIEEVSNTAKFDVAAIAPNPFDVATRIIYTNPQQGNVELAVYNMLGKLVYSNKFEAKIGKNTIDLSADKFSSGMYIYSLSNGKEVRTGKMTVSK